MKNTDSKKKKKFISLIVLILLLLLIPIIFVTCRFGKGSPSGNDGKTPSSSANSDPASLDNTGSAINGEYQGKSSAATLSKLEKEQVNVTESLSSSIAFPTGGKGTQGSWMLNNASSNSVIMQAEIEMNGQIIATSAAVRPGQHLESITLSRDIPSGSGKVIAYISYYNLQTKEYIGKAGYKITIVVQ